jgi:hypothetical protein
MPTPWLDKVKQTKKLLVYNDAGAWKTSVEKAIKTFNKLGFPVTLELTTEIDSANIFIKLSMGPDSHTFKSRFYGDPEVSTRKKFNPEWPHGDTPLVVDPDRSAVAFAATFLPGKLMNPSEGLKEVVIVHEFIHGCGLDGGIGGGKTDGTQDHDSEGIMYDIMIPDGGGLIEGTRPKGVKAMPPIRVGVKTRHKIKSIWT